MSDVAKKIAALSPEAAELLRQRLNKGQANAARQQIRPVPRDGGTLPVSFAQQRLWFLDQFEPNSPFYNITLNLRLTGPLDIEALQAALNEMATRHEAWRTIFVKENSLPMQKFAPPAPRPLPVTDLRHLPDSEREEGLRLNLHEESQRPFDLARGPLARWRLIQLQDEEFVLQIVMHHIVSDGWSIGLIINELTALYDAARQGKPSPLPELPIQYADFAVWQRQWLEGETLERQVNFWKSQLGGALPVLELATDRPRPLAQTFNGNRERFHVPTALSERLVALGRQERATLFMTLLAAYQVLLFRYSGLEDVLVGTPIAGRNRKETENLIGFFVNTLVLRSDLSGNPTFRQLLDRVREGALEAYAHQELPFEKLIEVLAPERSLSHSPLFQVMFILQNAPIGYLRMEDITLQSVPAQSDSAKYELTLTLVEHPHGLNGTIEYNTDLFDQATIARMAANFQTLLEGIVANPDCPIAHLPLLSEAERREQQAWNQTQRDFPPHQGIHHLVEAQAAHTPDAIAVEFEGQRLSYRALNERANQLAHHLRALGAGSGQRVAIFMERSLDLVVALLATLKSGAAYVPLDPIYPRDRLAYMLADAGVPLVLTDSRLATELPEHGARVVALDTETALANQPLTNPASAVTGDALSYVIYTSGSTGKPKGVQVRHAGVTNFLHAMRDQIGLDARDTLLAVTTIAFDISVLELFLPLVVGARLVVASRTVASDGVQLGAALAKTEATVMQATPATWRLLLESGWQGRHTLKMLCGGEALPRDLRAALLERGAALWNLYGPTETTIWSTAQRVASADEPLTIGRPIANTQVHLLDRYLQPVPVGVVGELHIGGAGLARDYLARPDLTAARFIPDPFSAESGARLYKTGDLARYLPTGAIEFLGRNDHQVKIRGYRIELGEIEARLLQHEAIRHAVVVARDLTPNNPALVAYLVAQEEEGDLSAATLRPFLRDTLPDYMVPAAFVVLDTLPLTPNGKIDRRALPDPNEARTEPEVTYVAPSNPVEEVMAEVWAEVLGRSPIGIHDNFFDLGGHSLMATQVISRLNEAFEVDLALRALFEAPTVAGLSALIEAIILAEIAALEEGEAQQQLLAESQSEGAS